jgi:mono/diheme cytochrome c family protein
LPRFLATCLVVLSTPYSVLSASPAADAIDFDRDVKPIFTRSCVSCHGPQKQRSSFRLDRKADALKGGDLGRAVVPGKAADSPLIRYVSGTDPDVAMPPDSKKRLTATEVATLRAWIDQGAKWPDDGSESAAAEKWWALKPFTQPTPPKVADRWARTPIDAFVLAKLREKGLKPSPEADRRTLIRRAYFDLIGLPPTFEEVEAFAADPSPDAYVKLIDRLLASPRYGERWARHWLDVVHYGETHGYDKDKPRPNAWPYRDYVIRAINEDKPYSRFVQEQVAGDVLFPGTVDGVEALGFIAAGPWDFIGHAELPEDKIDGKVARHLDRDDMAANTIGTFVSLTVHCAQCHNHKFDPIPQEDYYRLQAVFAALDRADKGYDPDPAVGRRRSELTQRLRVLSAVAGPSGAEPIRRELADLPPQRFVYAGTVHHGSGTFVGTGPTGGKTRPIRILPRGDVTKPGQEVGPGALSAVSELKAVFDLPPDHPEGERRAALARWLTDRDNPLVWRSIVNRVWLYHMGRGIVDTPNDFGKMGQPPTHTELLDWLAADFRDNGQSLKKLHRLIMTSAVYRQSSASVPAFETADAANAFYWRMTRRKLEAEAVRDSILLAAGKLDLSMGGSSFQDFQVEKPEHSPHYQYHLHDADDPKSHRRSVYRFVVRSKPQPWLAALDCADPSQQVDRRNQTITPQQALALLNSQLTAVMAKHFAARVEKLGDDTRDRLTAAVRIALGRSPSVDELNTLATYADKHGLANACRVVLNMNEFAFVD